MCALKLKHSKRYPMVFFAKVPLYLLMFMVILMSLTMKTIMIENRVLILRTLGLYKKAGVRVMGEEEEEEWWYDGEEEM